MVIMTELDCLAGWDIVDMAWAHQRGTASGHPFEQPQRTTCCSAPGWITQRVTDSRLSSLLSFLASPLSSPSPLMLPFSLYALLSLYTAPTIPLLLGNLSPSPLYFPSVPSRSLPSCTAHCSSCPPTLFPFPPPFPSRHTVLVCDTLFPLYIPKA